MEVERIRETVAAEQEIAADQDRDGVAQTLGSPLAIHRALGEYRSQQPNNEKNDPANADNIFRQRIHAASRYHQSPSRTKIAGRNYQIRDSVYEPSITVKAGD